MNNIVNCNQFTVEWIVENYFIEGLDTCIKCPIFQAESLGGMRWSLELSYSKFEDNAISVVTLCNLSDIKEEIDYRLEVADAVGKIMFKSLLFERQLFMPNDKNEVCTFTLDKNEIKHKLTITCIMKNNIFVRASEECQLIMNNANLNWAKAVTRIDYNENNEFVKIPVKNPLEFLWNKSFDISLRTFEFKLNIGNYFGDDALIRMYPPKSFNSFPIVFKVSLLDVNRVCRKSKTVSYTGSSITEAWEVPAFFTVTYLDNHNSEFVKDGEFTLKFEFLFISDKKRTDTIYYTSNVQLHKSGNNSLEAWKKALQEIRSSDVYTDVTLKTNEKEIRAHKFILSARSPVFAEIFAQEQHQDPNSTIDCSNIEPEILAKLLTFLYTGSKARWNCKIAMQLLKAAHMFQVNTLVEECAYYLKSALTTANVCQVLEVADQTRHEDLLNVAFNFIRANQDILKTNDYMEWFGSINQSLRRKILNKSIGCHHYYKSLNS